jgi:hypothetical protein
MGRCSVDVQMKPSLILLALLAAACGSSSDDDEPAQSSDAGADTSSVKDPSCEDGKQYTSLPAGACVEGATCQISTVMACPDGHVPTQSPHQWSCECKTDWDCTDLGGGLSLPNCDGGI